LKLTIFQIFFDGNKHRPNRLYVYIFGSKNFIRNIYWGDFESFLIFFVFFLIILKSDDLLEIVVARSYGVPDRQFRYSCALRVQCGYTRRRVQCYSCKRTIKTQLGINELTNQKVRLIFWLDHWLSLTITSILLIFLALTSNYFCYLD